MISKEFDPLDEIKNDITPIWMEFEQMSSETFYQQADDHKELTQLSADGDINNTSQHTIQSDCIIPLEYNESPLRHHIDLESSSSKLTFSDMDSQDEIKMNNREKSPVICSTMHLKNESDNDMATEGKDFVFYNLQLSLNSFFTI